VTAGRVVLVVHDDPELARATTRVIQCLRLPQRVATVIAASKGEAENVLERVEKWHECLAAVIDIGLPEGPSAGHEFARWIRDKEATREGEIRRFLVGVTAHEHRVRHFGDGSVFDLGLQSPFAPARLVDALTEYLVR
jgi:CheY-like chemotaxis protein